MIHHVNINLCIDDICDFCEEYPSAVRFQSHCFINKKVLLGSFLQYVVYSCINTHGAINKLPLLSTVFHLLI